ncbi:ABC transporter permease [Kiloniella sp. b19]|uniref:ABC transporter permease n=1 Tax=Kiloniella sp. GXU_MW_B19 TaxID=3141326 RepID=UPI0031D3D7F9
MNSLVVLIGQRLTLGLITLFVVSILIFAGVELLPGDLAQEILGQSATPETLAAFRAELGLDKPPLTRYIDWLAGVFQGDLGNSLANKRPIAELLDNRLKNTFFLAAYAAVIAVPVALILGVLSALFRNSVFDRSANVFALTSISFPEFFMAYLLILFLAVQNLYFPPIAKIIGDEPLGEALYRTFLPALTLTLIVIAHMMRMTRAAIINLLATPYIEMARLKGLSPLRIIVVHALPNALAPIINVIALNLAYLIVGVVVVEVVFVYPGLGQMLVDAVSKRDIPVVQAISLIFAGTFIFLNLLADILSILSNPRLRHAR